MPKGTDKAGEAFIRLAEHDPGARRFLALLEAAKPKLIALNRLLADAQGKSNARLRALAEEFGRQTDEESLAWQELFGEPFPQTIDDWQRWAARLGLSAAWIIKGDWAPGDLLPMVEGRLLLRKDQAGKQAAEPTTNAKLSASDLAKKHGLPSSALRKRLDRWRYEHDVGYVEVSNAAKNEPRFLYEETTVMAVIDALKAKSVGQKRATDGQQKKI